MPVLREVPLRRSYRFMYEGFVLSDQYRVYFFLEREGAVVHALTFGRTTIFKFGAPNDEAIGGHPLARHGLWPYRFYEVENSPWIAELIRMNRVHPNHTDASFSGLRHFIVMLKDVTFEAVSQGFEETSYTIREVNEMLARQIEVLEEDPE